MKFLQKTTNKVIFYGIIGVVLVSSTVLLVYFGIDRTPPTVEFSSPLDLDIISGTHIVNVFNVLMTDTGGYTSGIQTIEHYIDNTLVSDYFLYAWDTTEYDDGYHTLYVKVTDGAGNIAEAEIVVTVDNFLDSAPIDMFKILNYNVFESGVNPEWKDVVKAENPDIAVFVETGDWDNSDDKQLNDYVKEFNGYFYDEAPYIGYTTQGIKWNTQGEAILSRYPVLNVYQAEILHADDDSTVDLTHALLHVVVDIEGNEVHIIAIHLKAGQTLGERNTRDREQEAIINYMDENVGDAPLIYIGDLNCNSPEDIGALEGDKHEEFGIGPVSMILYPDDPIYGNYSSEYHNFTDVFRTLNPADPGFSLHIPSLTTRIDYIFVNQYFTNAFINSTVKSNTEFDDVGSDHYTVDAFISIENITITPISPEYSKVAENIEGYFNSFSPLNKLSIAEKLTQQLVSVFTPNLLRKK
ncbi:MAG: endonuclease/exonuclease/phosphatase family protein [Candidatus Heimdallarchaeaceae archaeon]